MELQLSLTLANTLNDLILVMWNLSMAAQRCFVVDMPWFREVCHRLF